VQVTNNAFALLVVIAVVFNVRSFTNFEQFIVGIDE
jgi:hypothetical protein